MVNASATITSYFGKHKSGSQDTINPDTPFYGTTMGSKNMYTLQARLGPIKTLGHLVTAHTDSRFAREFSLAAQYDSPATAIPIPGLGKPNERSDNIDTARSGGYHLKPENGESALENTVTIPGTDQKQENPYQSYSQYYKNEDDKNNPVKKQEGKGAYKIFSIVRALERKAKQYFRGFYNPHRKSDESEQAESTYDPTGSEDIFSMPTLAEYGKLKEVKRKYLLDQSSGLEDRVNASIN